MNLQQAEQIINQFIADILAHGNDDALFASGYLQGHIDLILQRCFENDHVFDDFISQMETSLNGAYAKNELSQPDRLLVVDCWDNLKTKF